MPHVTMIEIIRVCINIEKEKVSISIILRQEQIDKIPSFHSGI